VNPQKPANSPSAATANVAPSGFGPGYAIGFFATFAMIIASFVMLIRADDYDSKAAGIGNVLISFGAAFTFGIGYTLFTRKGIPWSVNLFGNVWTGVLTRRDSVIGFWLLAGFCALLSVALLVAGIWIRTNSKTVGDTMQRHAQNRAQRHNRD
jgi:hypothetical protein